jgi:uncharacterized repeat protein (TIGR01451 family)
VTATSVFSVAEVSAESEVIEILASQANISVVKLAQNVPSGGVDVGSSLTFQYIVTNTGDEPLLNVVVREMTESTKDWVAPGRETNPPVADPREMDECLGEDGEEYDPRVELPGGANVFCTKTVTILDEDVESGFHKDWAEVTATVAVRTSETLTATSTDVRIKIASECAADEYRDAQGNCVTVPSCTNNAPVTTEDVPVHDLAGNPILIPGTTEPFPNNTTFRQAFPWECYCAPVNVNLEWQETFTGPADPDAIAYFNAIVGKPPNTNLDWPQTQCVLPASPPSEVNLSLTKQVGRYNSASEWEPLPKDSNGNQLPVIRDENGTFLVYEITLTNSSASAHEVNAAVIDLLPPGTAFAGADPSYNPETGIWVVGRLAQGETKSLYIRAEVIGSGVITNTATVLTNTVEIDDTDNHASASFFIQAEPEQQDLCDIDLYRQYNADKCGCPTNGAYKILGPTGSEAPGTWNSATSSDYWYGATTGKWLENVNVCVPVLPDLQVKKAAQYQFYSGTDVASGPLTPYVPGTYISGRSSVSAPFAGTYTKLTYTYQVTNNSSDEMLINSIWDQVSGGAQINDLICTVDGNPVSLPLFTRPLPLPANTTMVCSSLPRDIEEYEVSAGRHNNTVVVKATVGGSQELVAADSLSVLLSTPSYSIDKLMKTTSGYWVTEGSGREASFLDTLTFGYKVVNNGNEPLANVTITDQVATEVGARTICTIPTIPAGQSYDSTKDIGSRFVVNATGLAADPQSAEPNSVEPYQECTLDHIVMQAETARQSAIQPGHTSTATANASNVNGVAADVFTLNVNEWPITIKKEVLNDSQNYEQDAWVIFTYTITNHSTNTSWDIVRFTDDKLDKDGDSKLGECGVAGANPATCDPAAAGSIPPGKRPDLDALRSANPSRLYSGDEILDDPDLRDPNKITAFNQGKPASQQLKVLPATYSAGQYLPAGFAVGDPIPYGNCTGTTLSKASEGGNVVVCAERMQITSDLIVQLNKDFGEYSNHAVASLESTIERLALTVSQQSTAEWSTLVRTPEICFGTILKDIWILNGQVVTSVTQGAVFYNQYCSAGNTTLDITTAPPQTASTISFSNNTTGFTQLPLQVPVYSNEQYVVLDVYIGAQLYNYITGNATNIWGGSNGGNGLAMGAGAAGAGTWRMTLCVGTLNTKASGNIILGDQCTGYSSATYKNMMSESGIPGHFQYIIPTTSLKIVNGIATIDVGFAVGMRANATAAQATTPSYLLVEASFYTGTPTSPASVLTRSATGMTAIPYYFRASNGPTSWPAGWWTGAGYPGWAHPVSPTMGVVTAEGQMSFLEPASSTSQTIFTQPEVGCDLDAFASEIDVITPEAEEVIDPEFEPKVEDVSEPEEQLDTSFEEDEETH